MNLPIIRYYLDSRKNTKNEQRIFIDISFSYSEFDYDNSKTKYERVKYFSGCYIKPEYFVKQVNRGSKTVSTYDEKAFNRYSKSNRAIKTKLEQIETAINNVANRFYVNKQNPSPKEFKSELLIELGETKKQVVREKSVLEFLQEKIKTDKEDTKQGKKNALSVNHIKTYVSLSRMFENYEIATKSTVMFSDFNAKNFQWDFFEVVDSIYRGEIEIDNPNQSKKQRKDPTGYGVKSINKYIKLLHRVLKLGKGAGYNMTLDVEDSSLKLENPPPQKEIYLNENELKKIIDTKVIEPELLNAKQYLVMASLMGLRIEDMSKLHELSPKSFKKDRKSFLGVKVNVKKTKTEVIIPILKPVKEILDKNQGKFPLFRETVNKHIKTLCSILKIDTLEERTKISFRDGKLETVKVPKCELLTTHDFRRSFVTNLGLKGVNQDIVASITHPKKKDSNNMMAVYNNSSMVDKAFTFLDAIDKIESNVYTL